MGESLKKIMSWIDIKVWINEQRELIRNSYIDNIFSIQDGLILRLKKPAYGNLLLIMLAGKAILCSKKLDFFSRLSKTNNIAMGFRKYIRECRIKDIDQIDNERIIIITIECRNSETYRLVIEIIPRGTIILIDNSDKVIMITKPIVAKDRLVRIGHTYTPPPRAIDPLNLDPMQAITNISKGIDLVRGIIIGLNYPPEIAEEFLCRSGIDKNTKPQLIEDKKLFDLIENIKIFTEEIIKNPKPCTVTENKNGKIIGAFPFRPECIYRDKDIKETTLFNDAIELLVIENMKELLRSHDPNIQRIEKSIEKIESTITKMKSELDKLNIVKSIIDENYNHIENIFLNASKLRNKDITIGVAKIKVADNSVVLEVNGLKYKMDLRRSFIENYISLSKTISSLNKKVLSASKELENFKARLKEEEEKLREKIAIDNIKSRRTYEWFEKFYWIITSEGLLAIGGINADQNESIVKRYMDHNDIFIHADIHGAPVVVLKADKSYTINSIREASYITACYSRAWKLGYGSVDVFYVEASQVSKAPPSGEYLAKGSFMIYGKKNWIRKIPLELGIGIEITDKGYPRIIAGPVDLIHNRAVIYSKIIPGNEPKDRIIHAIRNRWIALSKNRIIDIVVKSIEDKELMKWIPGNSQIIESRKGARFHNIDLTDIITML